MADERFRRPNAMKHGVFSKTALFPWEDGTEFQALHSDLQDEWQPSGALEEDAVFTILTCVWRKRRIFDKRNLEIVAALQEQEFVDLTTQPPPLFDTRLEKNKYSLANRPNSSRGQVRDRVAQLLGFSSALYGDLDERFLNLSISMLDKEFSTHLRQEVPKEKYPTTPEWVMAVKREVDEVMLPRVRAEMIGPVHLAAKAAAFLTADRIIADLTLEERLDAMIDRAIRRLAQGKMMKQVAGITEHQQHLPAVSLKIARPKYKRAKAKKPNN